MGLRGQTVRGRSGEAAEPWERDFVREFIGTPHIRSCGAFTSFQVIGLLSGCLKDRSGKDLSRGLVEYYREDSIDGRQFARPMFARMITVRVARFVAQLREGLKKACERLRTRRSGRRTRPAPFERSKNVLPMLESPDKLRTKSEK